MYIQSQCSVIIGSAESSGFLVIQRFRSSVYIYSFGKSVSSIQLNLPNLKSEVGFSCQVAILCMTNGNENFKSFLSGRGFIRVGLTGYRKFKIINFFPRDEVLLTFELFTLKHSDIEISNHRAHYFCSSMSNHNYKNGRPFV